MPLQLNSSSNPDGSTFDLGNALRAWLINNEKQIDGGIKSNRTPWRFFVHNNQIWHLNGDTRRDAVIQFLALLNHGSRNANGHVLIQSSTVRGNRTCLRLYGSNRANGWYCYLS